MSTIQDDDTYAPTGIRRLPPEEFDLVAERVGLAGAPRLVLRFASVDGLTPAEIAADLRLTAAEVQRLLDEALRTFAGFRFTEDWGRMVLEAMRNGQVPRDSAPPVVVDRYGQGREARLRSPLVTPADLAESAPPGRENWRSLPADVLGRRDGADQAGWLDREAEKEARERVERLKGEAAAEDAERQRKGRSGG